ncbi:hypothetical protein RFI_10326 [Reticulomyxa filosa]|uniref:ubiquitinyl hydrolase 1 n=1 Tax=Reticulomyxa filosa TaxID=46433 RepID=X6NLM0_RETFI|nr:hypothetical protein RFI_10326 [Reticulomyxa filosa]|eukprot:ETO26808.1 hypothetical protein RFI_10326 [Reticulomyxa filosa]
MESADIKEFAKANRMLKNEICPYYRKQYHMGNDARTNEWHSQVSQTSTHDHTSIDKYKMLTIIDDVFEGQIESIVTCQVCSNSSRTTEEVFDLSLPISAPVQEAFVPQTRFALAKSSNKGWKVTKGSKRNKKYSREKTPTPPPPPPPPPEPSPPPVAKSKPSSPRGFERLKGNCSIFDCLAAFTDAELLHGSNKYQCRDCTIAKLKREFHLKQEKNSSESKEKETVVKVEVEVEEAKVDGNNDNGEATNDKEKKYKKKQSKDLLKEKEQKDASSSNVPSENEDGNDTNNDEAKEKDLSDLIHKENLKQHQSLLSAEDRYVMKRLKELPTLEKCNATKRLLISKPPKVLTLHLKRFEQRGHRLNKVSKSVRFPLHLDISPFLTDNAKTQFAKQTTEGSDNVTYRCMYQLYGVVVHLGGMGGGHYISYTHKDRTNVNNFLYYYTLLFQFYFFLHKKKKKKKTPKSLIKII